MEYYGILPERKPWVKIAVILLSMYAVWDTYTNGNWFYLPFGMILILATFSSRKQVISDIGVDIVYTVLGQHFHNMWEWDVILAVHTDKLKSAPNVEMHFNKGVINRRFILSKNDSRDVIELIGSVRPEISVTEVNHNKR